MPESSEFAWGVCYGDPDGPEENIEIISVHSTEGRATEEAFNWSMNNEGDPNYFVSPVHRKEN